MSGDAVKTLRHPVAAGETLSIVAATHSIAVAKIRELNPRVKSLRDAEPIDRSTVPVLEVPLKEPGTGVVGMLAPNQRHELETEHRFSVLCASGGRDPIGLLDVLEEGGAISIGPVHVGFDIAYAAPLNVPEIHWAAALVGGDETPWTELGGKPGGYAGSGDHTLKKRADGGGAAGDKVDRAKLEQAMKKEGRVFLASGSEKIEKPGLVSKAIRLTLAKGPAATAATKDGTDVTVEWAKIPLKDLDPAKPLRVALVAANGGSAVDGAASGVLKIFHVTIDVELPELAPGLPPARSLEVRLLPHELPKDEGARLDPTIYHCSDSISLKRDAKYKDGLGKILGEKAFEKEEEYTHGPSRLANDAREHFTFRVKEGKNEVDVPLFETAEVFALGDKILDTIVAGAKKRDYKIAFWGASEKELAPVAGDGLRVRLFTRQLAPKAGVAPEAVDAGLAALEDAEKKLDLAEKAAKSAREQKLGAESDARAKEARLRALLARRAALVAAYYDAWKKTQAKPEGDEEAAAQALDRMHVVRDELFRFELASSAGLAEADAAAPSSSLRTGKKAAAEDAAKNPAGDPAEKAAADVKAARKAVEDAEKTLTEECGASVVEVVPPGREAPAATDREPGRRVVSIFLDGKLEGIEKGEVDGEPRVLRGEAARAIEASEDLTYIPPPAPFDAGGGGFSRTERRLDGARFARRAARPGDEVGLTARSFGLPEGHAVTFVVKKPGTDFSKEVAAKPAPADRTRYEASWKVEAAGEGDAALAPFIFIARAEDPDGSEKKIESPPAPPLAVQAIKGAKAPQEAQVGDEIELAADLAGHFPPGTPALFHVHEHDEGGAHEHVTTVKGAVRGGRAVARWKVPLRIGDEHKDASAKEMADKGYKPARFFFEVEVEGLKADSGKSEELLLEVGDVIDRPIRGSAGELLPGARYEVTLADGTVRQGVLTADSRILEKNVPPGKADIRILPDTPDLSATVPHGPLPPVPKPRPPDVERRARVASVGPVRISAITWDPPIGRESSRVTVRARVSGAEEGAPVTVRVFAKGSTAPAAEVAGKIASGWAKADWTARGVGDFSFEVEYAGRRANSGAAVFFHAVAKPRE